jgi:hypothetical protein
MFLTCSGECIPRCIADCTSLWLQVRHYPSPEAAISVSHLAALLYAEPRRQSPPPPTVTTALTSAEAKIAAALSDTPAGAAEAATVCLRLAADGVADAWPVAARLCMAQEQQLEHDTTERLAAYALEFCNTATMSQLLAVQQAGGRPATATASGAGSLLTQLGIELEQREVGARWEGLEHSLAACYEGVSAKDVSNWAPTLGAAPQAVLLSVEILRTQGPGVLCLLASTLPSPLWLVAFVLGPQPICPLSGSARTCRMCVDVRLILFVEHFKSMLPVLMRPTAPVAGTGNFADAHRERVLRISLTSAAIHTLTLCSPSQTPTLNALHQPAPSLIAAALTVASAAGAPTNAAASAALVRWLQEELAEEVRSQALQRQLPEFEGQSGVKGDRTAAVLELGARSGRAAAAGTLYSRQSNKCATRAGRGPLHPTLPYELFLWIHVA